MTGRPRTTRRGFLAAAGAATLAGCNRVGDRLEDDGPKIDGSDLRDVLADDPPAVPETLPVDIERSRLDGIEADARDRLSSVPSPFDDREVPNGAIRAELTGMRERATESLADARSGPSPAERMDRLRRARERAEAAAAAWEAVDDGLAREEVAERAPAVREDLEAFRGRWRYVAGEPIRAVVAHAAVEERVASAARSPRGAVEHARREPENPMTVGELAGDIERARAALDDAGYLFDRYAGSLDDPRAVGEGLRTAGERLTETLDERREALPDGDPGDPSSLADGDVEGTAVGSALGDLYRSVSYADGLDDERASGLRASIVCSAHETLVRVRAFETLRERVANGDRAVVESADDVRALRERAVAAVEDAVESTAGAPLAERVLSEVAAGVGAGDHRLERYADRDGVAVRRLDYALGEYVAVEATVEAIPVVSATVADEVRARL